jgi:tetratricopeptide (TPR) repeat protein
VPPGPLRTLKNLVYEAYVAAGTPRLSDMHAAIAREKDLKGCPSRDVINQIIGESTEIGKQADVVALVTVLTKMTGGEGKQAGLHAAALWTEVKLAEPLGGPTSADPYDLEVHHTITMQGSAGLPPYLKRAHDITLRGLVAEAAAGASRFVMLVGTPSSGKTRACYEAVQHLPDDWRLWHPIDPGRPEAALADLQRVGPKTVVWLNDAHHYLLHSEHSRAITAGLRTLLADASRAPVLVLGTIWPGPDFFDKLRTDDQARILLAGRSLHIPTTFEPADAERLKRSTDPRLVAAAHSAPGGMITQYLAAAFELVNIYDTAPPSARALLDAAIDARRFGHPVNLPLPFLEAAAEGYLPEPVGQLLPDRWIEQALPQLAEPVRGVPGPLYEPRRPRKSTEPSAHRYVRLADFLEDHGWAVRRLVSAPSSFWQAAVDHCEGEAARNLAREARKRGLMQTACCLWAKGGDPREVVDTLESAGRRGEAMAWCEREAAGGNAEAITVVGHALSRAGHADEANDYFKRAVEAGDTDAIEWITMHLLGTGRLDEALGWYERAADAGNALALIEAAHCLVRADRLDEALDWFDRAAAAGDADAVGYAANALWNAGLSEKALERWNRAVAAGDSGMLGWVAVQLAESGRMEEASDWCARAADNGDTENLRNAAHAFAEAGRVEEAVTWYERAADNGDVEAAGWLEELLPDVLGGLEETLAWCERKAAAGGTYALRLGAYQLADTDRLDEAMQWAERAAEAGDTFAFWRVADLLVDEGRLDIALVWRERAAGAGDTDALWRAARDLAHRNRLDEALVWCDRAAEAGVVEALIMKAGLLGRVDDALVWYERAAEAGDRKALMWAATRLKEADRLNDALVWYERAAAAGVPGALTAAARELAEAGRRQEALAWYQRATAAGEDARRSEADMLRRLGRRDEADRLQRYGRDISGCIADPWKLEAMCEE